jgi:hypothetical protein
MFVKPKYVDLQENADKENKQKLQSFRELASQRS